ncbi:HipA domain-containing protein [Acidisoma silvae]|uniref:HipA domain-containing protein n=1 Tax=Acidisoma silvae TaxID=2802396 RepID=A0A963YPV6_9PROT|nr:HipA domain-containing protein [Acidisoma silvae]MCB8874419.1 HipA domain-containing protein [Acidisoma silvae]
MSDAGPPDGPKLAVWIDGAAGRVGALLREAGGAYGVGFVYDADYLRSGQALPLSAALPLTGEPYRDAKVRAFFENLLPEGERRREEASAARLDLADVFGLLARLGRECPGAVSVLPWDAPPVKGPGRLPADYDPVSTDRLADLVAEAAAGRVPAERLRFSLAGVQRKLALARDPATGAFLLPRNGAPTTWILKVEPRQGPFPGIVANEALCLAVARRLGLPTVHAERHVIGGLPVLAVARYDRIVQNGLVTRRHQEDAAQVLGLSPDLKYEEEAEAAGVPPAMRGFAGLFGRFAGLTRGPVDTRTVLLRAAYTNWLLGNSDAHLKNFAVEHGQAAYGRMTFGGHYGFGFDLAPLYDVVSVASYPNVDHRMAMRIGRTDAWDEVEAEDWLMLLAQLFPERRVARGVLRRNLSGLQEMAAAILPAIDAVIAEGLVTRAEAKPVRDVAGARIRHLNRTLDWAIPAETDAPIARGGGWSFS